PWILKKLSIVKNTSLIVALNSGCPPALLEELSNDSSLQYYVARNLNCPVSILEKLSNLKLDIEEDYFNSDYYGTMDAIISNPNCSISILEKLSKHPSSDVSESAIDMLTRRKQLTCH